MAKSRGKKFESEISKMLKHSDTIAFYYRPTDTPPSGHERFTPRSPIDFYCYLQGGRGLVIECKTVKTKSLPFSRFSSASERARGDEYGNQWRALEKCAAGRIHTFVLVNFYGYAGRDGQRGKTWAVPFWRLAKWRERHAGKRKSWPLSDFEGLPQLVKVAGSWRWGMLEP